MKLDRKESTKHYDKDIGVKSKKEKSKLQRKARGERKKAGVHLEPNTIESMSTFKTPIITNDNENLQKLFENDELSEIINENRKPKVLVTSSTKGTPRLHGFCIELASIIPNSEYINRRNINLKTIIKQSKDNNFTSVVVIGENDSTIDSMKIFSLPNGPTVSFRLSHVYLRSEHKNTKNVTELENVEPQVSLQNFKTMIGLKLSRILLSLFPVQSALDASCHQRTVTFKNGRDFIFFRHHRFKFRETLPGKKEKVSMNEVGPRFSLRLEYLHKGLFENSPDFEYIYDKRENMSNRRQFNN